MKPISSPRPETDRDLLLAFFEGNCPPEREKEARRLLKTPAGQMIAAKAMDRDIKQALNDPHALLSEAVPQPSAELRERILKEIGRRSRRHNRLLKLRMAAAVALPLILLNLLLLTQLEPWDGVETASRKIVVPAGEQMHVLMADGTSVMLNSETTLEYPTRFDRRRREVKLHGEAFFDVAKDAKRPFVVQTDGLSIRVVGTRFNLNTASPGITSLYLQEGKVRARELVSGREHNYELHPGQLLELNRESGETLLKSDADSTQLMGWMHKRYYFKNTPLRDLLAFLERNYGVECRVCDESLYRYTYTINFYNESIDQILSAMERITPLRIVRINDSITIYPL